MIESKLRNPIVVKLIIIIIIIVYPLILPLHGPTVLLPSGTSYQTTCIVPPFSMKITTMKCK